MHMKEQISGSGYVPITGQHLTQVLSVSKMSNSILHSNKLRLKEMDGKVQIMLSRWWSQDA